MHYGSITSSLFKSCEGVSTAHHRETNAFIIKAINDAQLSATKHLHKYCVGKSKNKRTSSIHFNP